MGVPAERLSACANIAISSCRISATVGGWSDGSRFGMVGWLALVDGRMVRWGGRLGWLARSLGGVVLVPDCRSRGRNGVGWMVARTTGDGGGHRQRWRVSGMGTIGLCCPAVPSTLVSCHRMGRRAATSERPSPQMTSAKRGARPRIDHAGSPSARRIAIREGREDRG
jgi:hypothetical protein